MLSIEKLFPFLRWRRRVARATLRDDLLAGVTGAVVVLPQGVAFATIASGRRVILRFSLYLLDSVQEHTNRR